MAIVALTELTVRDAYNALMTKWVTEMGRLSEWELWAFGWWDGGMAGGPFRTAALQEIGRRTRLEA